MLNERNGCSTDKREDGGQTLRPRLKFNRGGISLVEKLKADGLPIVLWGAGSMSYQTRRFLLLQEVNIDAVWVDNTSNEGFLDGIPIRTYETIAQHYKKFNVVCGHSRYDVVRDTEKKHSEINRIFCFVNICYGQWNSIKTEFIENHLSEYEASYCLFEDEISKDCFAAYLNCRNNEDYKFLLPACKETASYFKNPFFDVSHYETYLDIGAYDGDTVRDFLGATEGYEKIIAVEPENTSYEKLCTYVLQSRLENVETYNNGCWDIETTLSFELNEESSSIGSNGIELDVKRVDEQFRDENITLIKINFLEGVVETLRGAEGILKKMKPKLAITVGFDEWGLIRIPQVIKELNPEYRLGLRYASPMPARLILFGW